MIVILLLIIIVLLWLGAATAGINSLTSIINGTTKALEKKKMKQDLLKAQAQAQQGQAMLPPIEGSPVLPPPIDVPPAVESVLSKVDVPQENQTGWGRPASVLLYTITAFFFFLGVGLPVFLILALLLLIGTLARNNPGNKKVIVRKAILVSILPVFLTLLAHLPSPPKSGGASAPSPSATPPQLSITTSIPTAAPAPATLTPSPTPTATPEPSSSPSPSPSPSALPEAPLIPQAETPFRKAILEEANYLFKREPGKGWELKPPFESRVHTDEPTYIIVECFLDAELGPAVPIRDTQDLPTDEQIYDYACQIAKKIAQRVVKYNQDNHIPIDDDIVVDVDVMKEPKVYGIPTGEVTGTKNLAEAKYIYKKKKFVIMEPDQN
jgi:hypothetical protein